MEVIFQVSDDGIAFRYALSRRRESGPSNQRGAHDLPFFPRARARVAPADVGGQERVDAGPTPSYEEHYERGRRGRHEVADGAGWVYPALFRSGDDWLLVSEASLSRGYCATRLVNASAAGAYRVGFPDPREIFPAAR